MDSGIFLHKKNQPTRLVEGHSYITDSTIYIAKNQSMIYLPGLPSFTLQPSLGGYPNQ